MSTGQTLLKIKSSTVLEALETQGLAILPPSDVEEVLRFFANEVVPIKVVMLDPWYNKGYGGQRKDYLRYLHKLITLASKVAPHIFLWGFPEIIAPVVGALPNTLTLNAWLTWYYKNNPSVIRGWRPAQMACLHLTRPDAELYPEHFLNDKQLEKMRAGKLRYIPAPPTVIEHPLHIGFVGRKEQTGHPAQKPEAVFEVLYKMTTKPGDVVLDPMAGSGTTGAVARKLGIKSILNDHNEEYVTMMERRLNVKRVSANQDNT